MKRYFNVTGACDAQFHYMVDLRERLAEIKKLVDAGEYFTINRARQYGKTTTLAEMILKMKKPLRILLRKHLLQRSKQMLMLERRCPERRLTG